MNTKRPWWQWAIFGLVVVVILTAIFGEDESENSATETKTVTVAQPPPSTTQTTPLEPVETLSDAQEAVDEDDYARALAIATALGAAEEDAVRRRIANRIGRRALSAVRAGDRNTASSLLRRAGGYPRTQRLTQARASYRAVKARAAERVAAEQRRQAEEQRQRAAEEAEAEPSRSACDPNYSGCVPAYPPDVNCPEVDGPVQVTGSDPHGLDRDNDGVACE